MGSTSTTSRRRAGLAVLFVGVLVASSVGPALAAPRVFVASASVEANTAVPGEQVDVGFQLRNTGDSGAGSVQIKKNGSVVYENRYQVENGEIRNVTEQITFEESGRYRIRVNDKAAGRVQVSQTLAETTAIRPDGRTMELRGGRIPYDTRLTTSFPATNDSVAVESLTYRTFQNEFTRTVELYTDPANASVTVPAGERTTIYGAVSVQSRSGIEDQRIRIGVNESRVENSSLGSGEVFVYRAGDGNYTQLNTTRTESEEGRYVYEAPVTDTRALLVGSIAPSFSVSDHSLSRNETDSGVRIVVTANVTNTGGIEGNYTASMLVDGAVVDNQTVSLAPGETREITVSHRISRDGTYQVALDDQSVSTVFVATGDSEQDGTETATETPDGDATTESPDGDTGATDSETETEAPGDTDTETAEQADTATAAQADTATAGEDDERTDQDGATDGATGTTTQANDSDGGSGFSITADDVGLTEIAIGGGVAVIGVILVLLQRW